MRCERLQLIQYDDVSEMCISSNSFVGCKKNKSDSLEKLFICLSDNMEGKQRNVVLVVVYEQTGSLTQIICNFVVIIS